MSDDQTDVDRDRELIRALCRKYESLCDLRQRQESSVAPRAELAALAGAFPGALRELDCLPMEVLEQRRSLLCAVVEGTAQVERWMLLQIAYHGCMRAVLRIRRLQLEQERGEQAQGIQFESLPDEPGFESFDAQDLAEIRKPPGGRLNPWVLARVARDQAATVASIEIALWGASRGAFP